MERDSFDLIRRTDAVFVFDILSNKDFGHQRHSDTQRLREGGGVGP